MSGLLANELALLDGLRAGDEAVFAALVGRYGGSMLRVAQLYVRGRAIGANTLRSLLPALVTSRCEPSPVSKTEPCEVRWGMPSPRPPVA